jgi:signal peptidase II
LIRRALLLGLGALVLAVNILLEHYLMKMGSAGHRLIPGLADFLPLSNRGVSFSLFTQTTDTGRYFLMAVLCVIIVGVLVTGWQARNRLAATAYGLTLGGALGNLVDRAVYGGVYDFLALHLGSLQLFVCNMADIAISGGVVLLAADVLLAKPQSTSIPFQP